MHLVGENSLTRKIVDYCAWNHPYKKPENIWVSEFGWTPTGITGNGRCGDNCESGSVRPDTGSSDTSKYSQAPLAQDPQARALRNRRMQYHTYC